jgi:cyclopropane fatty-acyl-phospholipid synthase-like methyltransferase
MSELDTTAMAQAYDDMAARRAAASIQAWKTEEVDGFLLRLAPGALVLDLGSGPGLLAAEMRDRGVDVRAVDISPANVEACRSRGIDARVCDFLVDDLGGPYDGILAMSTLLHVPKARLGGMLERMAAALRPGGLALICVWGGPSSEETVQDERSSSPRFFASYDDDEFRALPTPGFAKVDVRIRTEPGRGGNHHPQVMVLRRHA